MKVWRLHGKVPPESSAKKSEIEIKMVAYFLTFYTVAEGEKNPIQHMCMHSWYRIYHSSVFIACSPCNPTII